MTAAARKKLLVIDDDKSICRSLKSCLSAGGYEVEVAEDGDRGLEAINSFRPDLVILDIKMPKIDGWEVLTRMRSRQATEAVPVIMLTRVSNEESKVLGFRCGVDDYLEKPFHALELLARVDRRLMTSSQSARNHAEAPKASVERIPVQTSEGIGFIELGDVYYVEGAGKYSYVHTSERKYLSELGLKALEDAIVPGRSFLRVHKSYLVNLSKVRRVVRDESGNYKLHLADSRGSGISVSRRKQRALKENLRLQA